MYFSHWTTKFFICGHVPTQVCRCLCKLAGLTVYMGVVTCVFVYCVFVCVYRPYIVKYGICDTAL